MRGAILRVFSNKFLIELDGAAVVHHIPVKVSSTLGIENRVVRFFAVGLKLQRKARQRRRHFVVFPGALAVKLCQKQGCLGAVFRLDALVLEERLLRLEIRFGDEALVPNHIVNAFHAAFVRHGKKRVDGGAERHGKFRQKLNIRHGGAVFPF